MYLTKPIRSYRSLGGCEIIKQSDFVEDIATGKREPVGHSYYSFLRGQKASEARELPHVFDVVRPA